MKETSALYRLHTQARRDWGIADQLSNDDLIDEKYQGIPQVGA